MTSAIWRSLLSHTHVLNIKVQHPRYSSKVQALNLQSFAIFDVKPSQHMDETCPEPIFSSAKSATRYFSVRLALATEIAILLDDRAMEIPECWDDVPCFPVEHGEVPLLCLDGAMGEVPWMTPLFWGTGRNIFRFRNIFICPNSNRLSVSL